MSSKAKAPPRILCCTWLTHLSSLLQSGIIPQSRLHFHYEDYIINVNFNVSVIIWNATNLKQISPSFSQSQLSLISYYHLSSNKLCLKFFLSFSPHKIIKLLNIIIQLSLNNLLTCSISTSNATCPSFNSSVSFQHCLLSFLALEIASEWHQHWPSGPSQHEERQAAGKHGHIRQQHGPVY